jgi:hypothetical protein
MELLLSLGRHYGGLVRNVLQFLILNMIFFEIVKFYHFCSSSLWTLELDPDPHRPKMHANADP